MVVDTKRKKGERSRKRKKKDKSLNTELHYSDSL